MVYIIFLVELPRISLVLAISEARKLGPVKIKNFFHIRLTKFLLFYLF